MLALAATVGVYLLVHNGVTLFPNERYAGPLGQVSRFAWLFALPFALLTLVAAWRVIADRKVFNRQVRRASLRDLSWSQFERLIGEMYRRRGYSVVDTPRRGSGGFDYLLAQGPERWLVQCKHWRSRKVGVGTVRELANLVAARQASGGVIITTGRFTPPAQALAASFNITLVDGESLSRELLALSQESGLAHLHPAHDEPDGIGGVPLCPECGGDMIKRTARHGKQAGESYWGCARYPDCAGVVTKDGPSLDGTAGGEA